MTHQGGGAPPRRREGTVIAAAFAVCLFGGAVRVEDTLSAPPLAAYLVAVVSCAVLPLRHRNPVGAFAGTTAVMAPTPLLGLLLSPALIFPVLVCAYTLTARTERRATSAPLPVTAVLLAAATAMSGDISGKDASRMVVVAASVLVAGALGDSTWNRRAYLAAVEERARRAEESRELEARRRVAEERLRIARELHDLVAHQITLANAQATVAEHLFDTRPDQTRRSLRELVATTGDALNDLRATVGLLRESGEPEEAREPAPGLSRLPTLLESFRRAGLEVTVHEEGASRPLPPGTDLTAYRIIQEALTNVTKHAGAAGAEVRLTWDRDRVTIAVADDGGGPPRTSLASDGPGHGLIGMRERAAAVGGRLTAGRRPGGGFLVSTELPLPPARGTGGEAEDAP